MQSLRRFISRDEQLWDMGNGGHLYIDPNILDLIDRYRQRSELSPESGGFLTGYYKGNDLHVMDITVPQQGDCYGRNYFNRKDPEHVKKVKQWYIETGGEINCLGEWHTHPVTEPYPSGVDTAGWCKFNKNRDGQQAIFLIAGTKSIWVGELLC